MTWKCFVLFDVNGSVICSLFSRHVQLVKIRLRSLVIHIRERIVRVRGVVWVRPTRCIARLDVLRVSSRCGARFGALGDSNWHLMRVFWFWLLIFFGDPQSHKHKLPRTETFSHIHTHTHAPIYPDTHTNIYTHWHSRTHTHTWKYAQQGIFHSFNYFYPH